ncbi:MAG: hypothetical protein ACOCUS_00070 [Polyangiales bacterium]
MSAAKDRAEGAQQVLDALEGAPRPRRALGSSPLDPEAAARQAELDRVWSDGGRPLERPPVRTERPDLDAATRRAVDALEHAHKLLGRVRTADRIAAEDLHRIRGSLLVLKGDLETGREPGA